MYILLKIDVTSHVEDVIACIADPNKISLK